MRKIFFATVLALIMSIQNFCGAATIESANFNGNDNLIYPVVHTGDAAIDDKINGKIQTEIQSFVKGLHYAAQYDGQRVAGAYTNYEVACNQAGNTVILSLLITESSYFEGAAHPSTYKHALNFNVGSGTLMGLDYLTDVGEGVSVDEIKSRVERALIRQCERDGLKLFDDALPLKQLPEHFYWDANLHVHFIFQQYEVAPYAAGIIDVDIDA